MFGQDERILKVYNQEGFEVLPNPINIKNMRFNNLVAIEKVRSRNKHTYWKFRCDCGTEKEIQTSHVTGGIVKSCGCMIGSARDLSRQSVPTDLTPRVCKICEKQFFGFLGDTRVYCYECSPRGASVLEAHKSQKRSMKHALVEYKGGMCVECGYNKCEGALQFHHLDTNEKDFDLSMIKPNKMPMSDLYKEVDKCVLLCANCHAEKHEVEDLVGAVMRLPPKDLPQNDPRSCRICSSEFVPNNQNRYYCYSCVPWGTDLSTTKRIRKKSLKKMLINYKGGKCQNCGYNNCDNAMHFHHRNPEEKEFGIARARLDGVDFTVDKIFAEVDKCDLLCANCHAELHYADAFLID